LVRKEQHIKKTEKEKKKKKKREENTVIKNRKIGNGQSDKEEVCRYLCTNLELITEVKEFSVCAI
jgi:hypothetical protein